MPASSLFVRSGGRRLFAGLEGRGHRAGETGAQALAKDSQVLSVTGGERRSEDARRGVLQLWRRLHDLGERRVLLFVEERESFLPALRPRSFDLFCFGVGFAAEAADRLGQSIDVCLALLAKLASHNPHLAAERGNVALVGVNQGQFLGEETVEDLRVSGLFAVDGSLVALAAADRKEDQGNRGKKEGGATNAAPPNDFCSIQPRDRREAYVFVLVLRLLPGSLSLLGLGPFRFGPFGALTLFC